MGMRDESQTIVTSVQTVDLANFVAETAKEGMSQKDIENLSIMENKVLLTKRAQMRKIMEMMPRGLTLDEIKFCWVDVTMDRNGGNMTQTCRDLRVLYRTLTNWVHGDYPTTCLSRGRGKPRKTIIEDEIK
jgi:hypothetical protein